MVVDPHPLSSPLLQLGFVAMLVVFATAVGQIVYTHASRLEIEVRKHIRDRKRPDLKYVLYDIFWAPTALLIVFLLIRTGVVLLPPGSVAASLATVVDGLLILALLWLSLRTVKEVVEVAEQRSE